MTAMQADTCALWALHCWAISAFDYTPYLRVSAPEKRCGKSRLLDVLAMVTPRPWRTEHATAAVLYRRIEGEGPTLLLDEIDRQMQGDKEASAAIVGVLNSGFEREGKFSACEKTADGIGYRDFRTFCPKALAGIAKTWDTVEDRSVPVALRRKAPSERVAMFRRREAEPQAAYLRERCEAWATQAMERLREARPEFPAAINDRQQDIAEPLLAIADLSGGDWPERARRALVELCTGAAAADESIGAKLLGDVRAIFAERQADRFASRDLAEALGLMEARPWAEWGRAQKPITPPQLARQLGRFGIAPRTLRLPDGGRLKGYERADFDEAWARYLPPDSPPDTSPPLDSRLPNRDTVTARINTGRNGNFESVTGEACHGSENAVSANKDGHCHGVTVSNPQTRQEGTQADLFAPPAPPKAEGETWAESIARARREGRLPAEEPATPRGDL